MKVSLACEGRILIWSFTDCLSPKLILECPREVTSVAVCPFDNNIIVGGCINGQVIKINSILSTSVYVYFYYCKIKKRKEIGK